MQNVDRKKAYQTLQNIYSDRKLSPASRMELNDYNVEFFTYSSTDRAGVNYIESVDGKSRGFTMINTDGQDVGLSIDYVVTLYNQEKNMIVTISMPLTDKYTEIKALTDQYGDFNGKTGEELERINNSIHTDFIDMMQANRNDLTFGDVLDTIDTSAKSITY